MHHIGASGRSRSIKQGSSVAAAVALAGVSIVGIQIASHGVARAVNQTTTDSGFTEPFAGTPQYEYLAPTQIQNSSHLNQPIGPAVAQKIAKGLGLNNADTFTKRQFLEFVTGGGIGGNVFAAALIDASVKILTNTVGRPLYSIVNGVITPTVLASYGLMVNARGELESPANKRAPTRQVNRVLEPGGYMDMWCRANGATKSIETLYKSAFTLEAVFGNDSQEHSDPWQLVPNDKGGVRSWVGMSMAPSIWLVNFSLIYTLNPALAADMPAKWAPIPPPVANAIFGTSSGQVPYSDYESYFK